MQTTLMSVYKRLPISFERGEGCWLWDEAGNEYLDALSGIAVTSLGHHHPAVTAAIIEQANKVIHTSNIFTINEQETLGRELMPLAQMEKVFFCNSGAEANEAAIKLARLYGHKQGMDNPQIIVMEKGFHGRTLATLSASSSRKIQAGYEPLVQGFIRAAYNNLDAIKTIAKNTRNIAAVMLEPILGNAGIIIPSDDYLMGLREICDKNNWLLILDEIQSGIGRTGKFYAFQHYDLKPDILTSAKALANGIPMGACMARGIAGELFQYGKHGSTFGGNPFASKVAQAVIRTIQQDKLSENAALMGDYLLEQLKENLLHVKEVVDIRGKGLMLAVELSRPCRDIYDLGLKNRILFSVSAENTLRILPPLIITQDNANLIAERLTKTVKMFLCP